MWEILLYNSQNATQTLKADITPLCRNVTMDIPLNNFEDLSFEMDLYGWKEYCSQIGLNPYTTLKPYTAEIKIKLDGVFLPVAFEIKQSPKNFTAGTISVKARGTLSKLGDRIATAIYTSTDSAAIARDLIADTQAQTYGDFGITNGNTYTTGVLTQRTYDRYNIMDAIRNLADDTSGGFDFYFDHDWKFYTMAERGSVRNDIVYKFGGEDSNVISYENPEDGTIISNSVTIVGEGIGDPITSTEIDTTSATEYGLRQTALVYSNIDNQTWLDTKAESEVRDRKDIYDLPKLTVDGSVFDLSVKWVGDTIPVACTDTASPYTGNGRIKRMSITLDDNHWATIDLELLKV